MFESFKGGVTKFSTTWIILLISLFLSGAVRGNSYIPRIKHLSIKDGMSNSRITVIFQDSKGFIWVGTRDGLNRYDGYEFREYKHDPPDSLTIPGNFIHALLETPDGNIWVGTKDNGIAIWDRTTDDFTDLVSVLPEGQTLTEKGILGMSFSDGYVWALTVNYLVRISTDLSEVIEYNHYNNVFKDSKYFNYPVVPRNGNLWIGSKDGLLVFDMQKELFTRYKINGVFFNDDISTLYFRDDTTIVIGCDSGLKILDISNDDMRIVWAEDSNIGYEPVNCVAHDQNNEIWIGTYRGIELSDYPFKTHRIFGKGKKWQKKISNIQVTSMLFDRSGILWVGTRNNGIFKINYSQPKFFSLSAESDQPFILNSYNFTTVFKDKEGALWLGTERDGLYRVDKDFRYAEHFKINFTNDLGFEDRINCLMEGENGQLWLGTPHGIFKLNKYTGIVREFGYAGSTEFKNLLRNNNINDLIKDRLGDLWIATNFGLYKYNGEKIVSYFEGSGSSEESSGLCSDVINVLHEDKHGWIWIGTKKGINYIKRAGEEFSRICNVPEGPLLISDNDIISFGESRSSDLIWIGTRSGLSYFDKTKFKFGLFSKNKMLDQTMICDVLPDDYNRLWIGTNKGIFGINTDGKVFVFTEDDGLPGFVFNINSAFKDENYLYFGGVEGLAYLNADSLKENMVIPNVVITDIEVLQKGKIINKYSGEIPEIEFKYQRNTIIKVDFAALEYTQPEHNWYRIKLENYDDDWRDETQVNTVSFSNLSPGKYKLKIMGANNDFVWNNDPTELIITIRPPLWMTGFAYVFYILFGAFIIQLIINFSVRKYRVENKRLREEAENKHRIEAQKEALSKFNKSLTDSISYAKRIQEAIIPSEVVFRSFVPESFVYYGPKDIVSGDFYWTYKNKDKVYVAVVDCTGHGVPGAFMSIVGHGMLRNIIEVQGEEDPAVVLDRMNEEVINVFKKNTMSGTLQNFDSEVNDGMDMVLCVIDKKNRTLDFAGAYNPMYLIRDNEIFTYKGDRFSIGHNSERKFRRESIQLMNDDIIYVFTDGYADQFGGPDNKKFKYRRFRHLLLNIHKLPMSDQKAILHQKMEEWKNYFDIAQEQVDDMLIIGIKPLS